MFVRRRRLVWLVVVIISLWVTISTYFVRNDSGDMTQTHNKHHSEDERGRLRNSAGVGAVGSNNDLYYEDEVIDIATQKHTVAVKPVLQSVQDFEEENDQPDNEIQLENVRKPDTYEAEVLVTKQSSVLRWRSDMADSAQQASAYIELQQKKYTPKSVTVLKQPPGNNGSAVQLNANQLSEKDNAAIEDGWQKYAHNEYVNRMISLQRPLPDVRDPECRQMSYGDSLPDVSVIVVFHNEAWRTLLRTVHSIINRSPTRLLRELILIDDGSTEVELKQQLDDYMALLPNVRVLHLRERIGVIQARQKGATLALGSAIAFLDSHCECTIGWLSPLLSRIAENRTVVAVPVMDIIDDSTFELKSFDAPSTNIGGFDWSLQFTWIGISDREKQQLASNIAPVRSPTMSGGMYVMSRAWFTELGGYDAGMDMWGAENLEMSFRVWMCGGSIEVLPCSHVGHVFRRRAIHNALSDWNTGADSRKNYFRVAEVWMDAYKDHFYEKVGYKSDIARAKSIYGDVSERQQLRSRLQCHSFDWYLKNVYPELFIPTDALASGELRSVDRKYKERQGSAGCLDSIVGPNAFNRPVGVWPCHGQGGNQHWLLSAVGEIRRDDSCMDFTGVDRQSVVIYPCHGQRGNQEWKYLEDGHLQHRSTSMCMELSEGGTLVMASCNASVVRQQWIWKQNSLSASLVQSDDKPRTKNSRAKRVHKVSQELAAGDY